MPWSLYHEERTDRKETSVSAKNQTKIFLSLSSWLQYKKGKVSKNYLLDYNELYTGL